MRHLRSDVEIGTHSAVGMYLSEGELSLVRWNLDDEVEWSICDAVFYFRSLQSDNRISSEAEPLSPDEASRARWLSLLITCGRTQRWWWAGQCWGERFSAGSGFCFWRANIPLWMPTGLLLIWPVAVGARWAALKLQRHRDGICGHCGYDLRGCMGQICTECGAETQSELCRPARGVMMPTVLLALGQFPETLSCLAAQTSELRTPKCGVVMTWMLPAQGRSRRCCAAQPRAILTHCLAQ
jgi:hypothetical protein